MFFEKGFAEYNTRERVSSEQSTVGHAFSVTTTHGQLALGRDALILSPTLFALFALIRGEKFVGRIANPPYMNKETDMPRQKQSKGVCVYCGAEVAKGGAPKHLAACAQRQAAMAAAKGKPDKLFHLRVRDAFIPAFWLELEVNGSSTSKDLDRYLRAIWLECCGHLSRFSIGGWGGDEISMSRRIQEVFALDVELTHIYDFGTSSETLVKAVAMCAGKATTKHPIALMTRNLMPETICMECSEPAVWLCVECMIETEQSGGLCDTHASGHPHDNYGEPMPIVNSPRVGMCGYEGPAEPPY